MATKVPAFRLSHLFKRRGIWLNRMVGMTDPVLKMISLDCADARKSGEFWSALLGWTLAAAEDEYAMVTGPETNLGFGTIADYEPPVWPNDRGSKQFHFDLAC